MKNFLEKIKKHFRFSKDQKPIEIFVRHCLFSEISHNKERISHFSKLGCFENLLSTIDRELANVTFFLDVAGQKSPEHFLLSQSEDKVITFDGGTETASFLYLLDYVNEKSFFSDKIIYFLEDDYLHRPDFCEVLLEAFTLPVDYVTLYDHNDKYFFKEYEDLNSKIFATPSCHWRTTPSTTNTYAMRYKTLKEDLEIHKKFSQGRKVSQDHKKFLELGERGRTLVSSIPGWSTHCEPKYASPCIDWASFFPINKS